MQIAPIKFSIINTATQILKPNYHLNYGKLRITNAEKNQAPFTLLGKVTKEIYTGGIFKRVFVNDSSFGIPYISAQHMIDINPLTSSKLISKKYTPRQGDMTLKENQILVSCAGSIGNVRLIDKNLEGVIGSQDIIRVLADDKKVPYGYLFAYLSSPTAYNYMQSFIYGSVVPRIEPIALSKLPVLMIDKSLISIIHEKIVLSYQYRNKAIMALNHAIETFEKHLPKFSIPKIYSSKLSSLKQGRQRFDSTYSNRHLIEFYKSIEAKGHKAIPIKSISNKVFTPDIFKRIKTEENAGSIPYLGGAELLEMHPKFRVYLSKKVKNIEDYILRKGWLAIQDSGSIQSMGYVSIIPSFLDGIAATNNLVRVVPTIDNNHNYYLYAFLKTKQGNQILKSYSYGTGQLHIDNKIVEEIKLPIISEEFDKITDQVKKYVHLMEQGYVLESEAINIIENEISSWQK